MSSVVSVLAQANRAKNKVRSVSTIRHQSEPFKKNPFVAQYFHLMSNTPISIRSDVECVTRVRRQAHVKKWTWENFQELTQKIPFLFYSPNSSSLLLGHWYEIMALYYVKLNLTEISASRQDKRVLQKSKIIRIKFLSIWGMLQTSR